MRHGAPNNHRPVARSTPHLREFLADTLTPVSVFSRLRTMSNLRFLFESISGGEQVSRFSFAGAAPAEVLLLFEDRVLVADPERLDDARPLEGPPLETLQRRMESIRTGGDHGELPFIGGWVGYFGWDLIRLLEHLPNRPPDDYGLPIAMFARYDAVVIIDHARQRIVLVSNEIDGEGTGVASVSAEVAERRLDLLTEVLSSSSEAAAKTLPTGDLTPARLSPPTLSDEEYREVVGRAKEYIAAGDIFQMVPARRWQIEEDLDPLALYRSLRLVNPSPYMFLLESPDVTLVGGSPEVLVRAQDDTFAVRPIAGTRPRGETPVEDKELEREMLDDPKEVAEHVMLVDLGRNDLGRVGRAGTVRVSDFMVVEKYSHVMHIVSNVEAERAPGRSALDALFACFPAGTLSGAPKIRALEIIDELEPVARGPYGGAVGYLSFNGDMDTCITIRTLVVQPGRITVSAGAGLVADSDPEAEQQETRAKAAALLRAVALAKELDAAERADDASRRVETEKPEVEVAS